MKTKLISLLSGIGLYLLVTMNFPTKETSIHTYM